MSTPSVPHSIELDDDVAAAASARQSKKQKKYATLEKCNSLVNLNGNLNSLARSATTSVNFEWYKQFRRNARMQMMKSKSTDAASSAAATLRRSSSTMQYTGNSTTTNTKSVNRDGTIARNHFRGVPGDFLDKHTKHFLLSMTVSIRVACDTWHMNKHPKTKLSNKKKIKIERKKLTVITSRVASRVGGFIYFHFFRSFCNVIYEFFCYIFRACYLWFLFILKCSVCLVELKIQLNFRPFQSFALCAFCSVENIQIIFIIIMM